MNRLAIALLTLLLAACGGAGDPAATPAGTSRVAGFAALQERPQALRDGPTMAVQLYQALYGQAPDNASYGAYGTQAGTDAQGLASSLAAGLSGLNDANLAKLVLDNIGITAASVTASGSYAALLGAVQQFFAAYGPAARGQIVLNLTGLLANLSGDATFGIAASNFNTQVSLNITYASSIINTVPAAVTSPITAGNLSVSGFTQLSGQSTTRVAPGASIYVTGRNFADPSTVLFNGVQLSATVVSPTQLLVFLPGTAGVSGPIIVGSGGKLATSPQSLSIVNGLSSVAWNGSRYVAAGGAGTILTSPDTINWTARSSATTLPLIGTACSPAVCVVVGAGGLIYSSVDGASWTLRPAGLPLNSNLLGAQWNGSNFLAYGGAGTITSSTDGVNWVTLKQSGLDNYYGVVWTGSQYLMVGNSQTGATVLTSATGSSWSQRLLSAGTGDSAATPQSLFGVAWTGSRYVAVGGMSVNGLYNSASSTDGVNWSPLAIGTRTVNAVVWSGSLLVAVGDGGTVLTSTDGLSWVARTSGVTARLTGITWTGSQFVAVGEVGTILTSPNGLSWTSR